MKIVRYPTKTEVHGYEIGNANKLERFLSVWDKARFEVNFKAFKYDEENKVMVFPSGIDHDLLYSLLSDEHDLEVHDERRNYSLDYNDNHIVKMKYPPRDELQRKSVEFLSGSKYSSDNTQKLLSLKTGEGKTYCGINYVSFSRRKPIIFINSNKLLEQWKEKILEYTDTSEGEIYILQGKNTVKKLMKMSKREASSYKFFLAMNKTIINVLEEDSNFLKELKSHTNISLKIFDEVHLDFRNIFSIDISLDIPSIYLSATPERSDRSENMVFQNIFWKVPKFNSNAVKQNRRAIPDKYHSVVMFRTNTKPTEEDKADFTKASRHRGINVNHYSKYIISDEDKMYDYFDGIRSILNDIVKDDKVAIMFRLKDQIEKFYQYLIDEEGEEYVSKKDVIRFYDGSPQHEKDMINESKLIITTITSLGTGIDIPGLKSVINTVPVSSKSSVTQIMGRLRYIEDTKLIMFDIVDHGFPQLVRQANGRLNDVYKKKAKEIIDFKYKK